jgi:hypothetical protein
MLQAMGDVDSFLENTTETRIMTDSIVPEFKRLNARGTTMCRLFYAKI